EPRFSAVLLERLGRGAQRCLSCCKRRLRIRHDLEGYLVRYDGSFESAIPRASRRFARLSEDGLGPGQLTGLQERMAKLREQAKACLLLWFEQSCRPLEQPAGGGHVSARKSALS